MRCFFAQFLNAGRPALTGEDSDVAVVSTAAAGRGADERNAAALVVVTMIWSSRHLRLMTRGESLVLVSVAVIIEVESVCRWDSSIFTLLFCGLLGSCHAVTSTTLRIIGSQHGKRWFKPRLRIILRRLSMTTPTVSLQIR
jgi:hypothetical protein